MTDVPKYRDEEYLREQFVEQWKTTREIADECDCCRSTVENWLDEYDIEADNAKRHAPDKRLTDPEWLREQYVQQRRDLSDIAEKCGCHKDTVRRWLKRHDIETKGYERMAADHRLTDAEWLREQYSEKKRSCLKIAEDCECTLDTVYRWFDVHDIERIPYARVTDWRLNDGDWLREQYVDHYQSMPEIAKVCGCSVGAVADALKRHDIETRTWPGGLTGEEHPCWKGGSAPYGSGWNDPKKRAVRERDGHTCQDPRCSVTQADHLDEYGEKLHVHHLRKARDVDDPEQRNAKENLITLCRECHPRWEKIADTGLVPEVAGDD